jgi:SAM-dependent methyltransferase
MYLKKILIVFSILILGFTLSLYFQTDQDVKTLNWDQYKGLDYNEERSYSLIEINSKISPLKLENIIQEISDRNRLAGKKTRVMEIGAGSGRALMTLKGQFRDVEFYSINKNKTHSFYRRESFLHTSLKHKIMTQSELEDIELPYVIFQDLDFGGSIPYKKNKFDLIYSHGTLRFIKYKFELFNEIMRVLKPGGISIHTNVSGLNIYARGVILEPRKAFYDMRKQGIDISQLDNPETIIFRKGSSSKLFPVIPHQPIPAKIENISEELRRPEMGYNLVY